jgi:hypothetical protein
MPHKMSIEKANPRLAISSFLNYTSSHEKASNQLILKPFEKFEKTFL